MISEDKELKSYSDELRKLIDCSLLRNDVTLKEREEFVGVLKKERFICAFVMPSDVAWLAEEMKDYNDVNIGCAVGFPTGAEPTQIKVAQTRYYHTINGDEVDLVLNIGWLKSGMEREVLDDVKAVVDASEGKPVKVILEVTRLNESEIRKGCELVVQAGADYVKTGTGFMREPTTVEHIRIMKDTVGDDIKIKAAGGIRDLDTMVSMINAGATRFGISWQSAVQIVNDAAQKYPEGIQMDCATFEI